MVGKGARGMMHTFLFEPGVWTSKGTFWRADGEPLEAQGRTEIAHHPATWLLAGTLKVFGSPPVEFVNAYSISPPGATAVYEVDRRGRDPRQAERHFQYRRHQHPVRLHL